MSRASAAESLAIRTADLDSPPATLLIAALNIELAARYPEPGANHFRLDAEEVSPANGAFLIGYVGGEPVACGAIRRIERGVAEIKRMYVVPPARGRALPTPPALSWRCRARQLG